MAGLFGVALGWLDGVNRRSSKASFGLRLLKGKLDVLTSAVM